VDIKAKMADKEELHISDFNPRSCPEMLLLRNLQARGLVLRALTDPEYVEGIPTGGTFRDEYC
jgi:hypothetical protein